ncbi:MAG: hypothetical protein V4696_01500 [Pseudomonadota bacterium]
MADVVARLIGEKLHLTINNMTLTQRSDGAWVFPEVNVEPLAYDPAVMSAVQYSPVIGQSLGQGKSGGMDETLVQAFLAKAFPQAKTTTTYGDLVPAIATNLTLSGGTVPRLSGEHPLLGLLGFAYELGNALTDVSAEHRIGINNAAGGSALSYSVKGGAAYSSTMAALTAAKNFASSIGKSVFYTGPAIYQGESNLNDTKAQYLAPFVQLAADHSADGQAITGQTLPPALFTYITCSNPLNTATRSGVARAQHFGAIDYATGASAVPIILSTPTYFMASMYDPTGLHYPADWTYMLGAYARLAQYYCYELASDLPLNERFPPMHPVNVEVAGAVMTVTYQMRRPGLSLEWGVADRPNGDGFALQEDYGFAAHDGTTLVPLNTPEIIGTNQIRFTLGSGTWGNGYRLGYALDRPTKNHLFFKGNGGNLRDNHGDTVRCARMNLPMHNWAAPIDINIGASNVWSMS